MSLKSVILMLSLAMAGVAHASDGAKLFASRCAGCHWAPDKPGEQKRMGPGLSGVVGRLPGKNSNFPRYSKAMQAQTKPWTEARLDAFLANPRQTVPGTNMGFFGLKDPKDRAAIIDYLKRVRAAR